MLGKARGGTQAEFPKMCWAEINRGQEVSNRSLDGNEHGRCEGLPDEPEVCVV